MKMRNLNELKNNGQPSKELEVQIIHFEDKTL